MTDDLEKRFESEVVTGTRPEFIAAKLAERDQRQRKAGDTRYLVEPNVKEGKGGLRYLHTLRCQSFDIQREIADALGYHRVRDFPPSSG